METWNQETHYNNYHYHLHITLIIRAARTKALFSILCNFQNLFAIFSFHSFFYFFSLPFCLLLTLLKDWIKSNQMTCAHYD